MASSTQSDLNHNPRHQEVHDLEYITIVDLMGHHAPRHTPEHETDWHQLAIRLEMALADPEIPRRYRIEYLILAAMVTSHFGNDRTPLLRLANENLEYLVRVWQRQGAPQWIIEERTAMLVDMLMAIDDPEQIERFKAREVARQEKEAAREEKEVCDKKYAVSCDDVLLSTLANLLTTFQERRRRKGSRRFIVV